MSQNLKKKTSFKIINFEKKNDDKTEKNMAYLGCDANFTSELSFILKFQNVCMNISSSPIIPHELPTMLKKSVAQQTK